VVADGGADGVGEDVAEVGDQPHRQREDEHLGGSGPPVGGRRPSRVDKTDARNPAPEKTRRIQPIHRNKHWRSL